MVGNRFKKRIMKNIILEIEHCDNQLLQYPCVDSNDFFLIDKKISLFSNDDLIDSSWFENKGAKVNKNPSDKESSFSNIGIVCPLQNSEDSEKGYYSVFDYYIKKIQLLIHKQKGTPGFKHLIIVLPSQSDECGFSYDRMAYYALSGLVKGLAKIYGENSIFINGIILNDNNNIDSLRQVILYLSSDNSNNTVGQLFKI